MAQIEDDFVLVLEDYHQIDTPAIHALLRDILRHPPAPLHLILVTRVDPPLDLLQMRARSRMGEIRANALRFTVDETSAFLDKALGVRVEDAVSAALTARTEGWIAGMYLIALAAENPADMADGSTALPGEHQTLDYLVAEAVARQPQVLQTFLLKISILTRFNASLCDAIGAPFDDGERPDLSGADFIRWLEERNLFVVSLDPHSQWFRYHHLFRDLLQSQLAKTLSTAQIRILHARACDWFLARDMADDAFDHALQAGDVERAIHIVDVYRYAEFDADRGHIVERWLDRLPPNVLAERPGLLLAKAWAHNHRNQMARLPSLIAQVDALLVGKTVEPMLLADLNFLRGNLQYWAGEGEESVRSMKAASAQLGAASARPAGGRQQIEYNVELLLALARCMVGHSEDAIRRLGDRIQHAESIEGQYKTHLMGAVAFIHLIDGDLSKARAQAERLHVEAAARQFANNDAWSAYLRGCADLHAFDLDSAANHFAAAIERRYMMHRGGAVDAMVGMVLTQQLRKQGSEATQALELLLEFAHETNDANALAVAQSCQARLCLLRGDLTTPMQWVQSAGETQISPVPFLWLEVPGITCCRALIGSGIAANLALAEQRLRKARRLYETNHFAGQSLK
jgi:LuxR family maltose regulon positive regulatory protein